MELLEDFVAYEFPHKLIISRGDKIIIELDLNPAKQCQF